MFSLKNVLTSNTLKPFTNKWGKSNAHIVFLIWKICVYIKYVGTIPPLNNIVKKTKSMISFRPTSSLREMVYAKSTVTIIPKAVPIKVTKIEFRKDFEITVPCLIRNSYASKLHFWGKYVYPYKFKTSLSVKDATAIKTTGAMHINEKIPSTTYATIITILFRSFCFLITPLL